MLPGDLEEDMDGFFRIRRVMYPDAVTSDLEDKTADILVQVGDHIRFNRVGTLAALLVIRDRRESFKAANSPPLGIPIQGNLQIFVRQGAADAGSKTLWCAPVIQNLCNMNDPLRRLCSPLQAALMCIRQPVSQTTMVGKRFYLGSRSCASGIQL